MPTPSTATPKRSPSAISDRRAQIETPERVAIAYELADLGSRFTALLIDIGILVAVQLALATGFALLARWLGAALPLLAGWGLALLILLSFALIWGYFVYFEGFRGGQTPGKRHLGIRVVHDSGYPLSVRGAAVRNLLRLIDIQPIPSWLVGGVAMLLHPSTKRLGDIAAGTVVVRERAAAALPEEVALSTRAPERPRLEQAEFAALAQYVARREELAPAVHRRIAESLAARLERHSSAGGSADAETLLQSLFAEEQARRTAGSRRAVELVRRQRERWAEYRHLLDRARTQGLSRLDEAEVSCFGSLYRELSADLARARTYGGSAELVRTLEALVGAGHNLFYRPPRRSWQELRLWLTGGFPALVRLRWKPIALAAAFFFLPALLTYGAVRMDPPLARELLPVEMLVRAEEGAQREREGRGYVEIPEVLMPVMATGIIANNVQVTFVAFAGGVLAGLGTLLVLVINGVFLGGVAALFSNHGLGLYLWSFVLPHGVLELTAIAIAGGAGLWLGSALLLPGRLTRREALVVRGREAVALLAGTVLMLLIAGLIEGFISPAAIPRTLKLLFAALFALLLALYLLAAGHDPASRERAARAGTLSDRHTRNRGNVPLDRSAQGLIFAALESTEQPERS